jgi:hypothetical protein
LGASAEKLGASDRPPPLSGAPLRGHPFGGTRSGAPVADTPPVNFATLRAAMQDRSQLEGLQTFYPPCTAGDAPSPGNPRTRKFHFGIGVRRGSCRDSHSPAPSSQPNCPPSDRFTPLARPCNSRPARRNGPASAKLRKDPPRIASPCLALRNSLRELRECGSGAWRIRPHRGGRIKTAGSHCGNCGNCGKLRPPKCGEVRSYRSDASRQANE